MQKNTKKAEPIRLGGISDLTKRERAAEQIDTIKQGSATFLRKTDAILPIRFSRRISLTKNIKTLPAMATKKTVSAGCPMDRSTHEVTKMKSWIEPSVSS